MMICGSFTLGRLFDFNLAHFGLTKFLTFLSKTYFVEKAFLINLCLFYIDIVFSGKKKIIV